MRSLWGIIERQDGLVLLAHLLAWMMILLWTARRQDEPRRLLLTYFIVSLGASVVASLSIVSDSYRARAPGDQFVLWRMLQSGARPGGVFENPVYSGTYLLLNFFWGLFGISVLRRRVHDSEAGRSRALWSVGLALLLVGEFLIALAMIVGQTRGVIFGLVAGLGVMALQALFGVSTPKGIRLAVLAASLFFASTAGVVWHYRNSQVVSRVSVLNRLTRLSPAENQSTKNRVLVWRSALQGFEDRPVLGWGPGNVYYALNKYYDPQHIQFTADFWDRAQTWYDKSHNAYLDLLVERGLLGVAAFLLVAAATVRALWHMSDRSLALCLSGGLAGYAVSNLVAFDTFGSLLALFLSLTAISLQEEPVAWRHWRRPETGRKAKSSTRDAGVSRAQKGLLRPLAAVLAVVLVLMAMYCNVQIAQATHGYVMARNAFEQDPGTGITFYEEAFTHFSPYHADEKLKCAWLTVNAAITKRPSSRSFDAGSLVLQLTGEALRSHPDDAQFYLLLNDMYNGLAMYGDRRLADDAERFGNRALELSPGRQEVMFTLGRTYIIKGQAARAVEINRRMVQEYPEFALGHWFLGLSYLSNSQRDEARNEIRTALVKGYRFQSQEELNTVKPLFDEKELAQLMPR
jgi:O-antigen ligase